MWRTSNISECERKSKWINDIIKWKLIWRMLATIEFMDCFLVSKGLYIHNYISACSFVCLCVKLGLSHQCMTDRQTSDAWPQGADEEENSNSRQQKTA
jgi:hypothetical protein